MPNMTIVCDGNMFKTVNYYLLLAQNWSDYVDFLP